LLTAIDWGSVRRGDSIVFCPRREFAFRAVPADNDHKHRYVDRAHIPDVVISRDIGKPHWCLAWLLRRTDILINRPDVLQQFDLRPRVGLMMVGPSGTSRRPTCCHPGSVKRIRTLTNCLTTLWKSVPRMK
jgi:hypothetical protein